MRTVVAGSIPSRSMQSRHVLTHLDAVHKDAGRLQKKTGCCLPAPQRSALPCCATEVQA